MRGHGLAACARNTRPLATEPQAVLRIELKSIKFRY
jgi:hypothetical protein